jgi:hypothetical protein
MPSGTPKFFTYRSVGSGTGETWVVTIYTGEVLEYIEVGDCISLSMVEG